MREAVDSDVSLLVSPVIRLHIYRLLERKDPDLAVLSYAEVDDDVEMNVLGTITVDQQVEEVATT